MHSAPYTKCSAKFWLHRNTQSVVLPANRWNWDQWWPSTNRMIAEEAKVPQLSSAGSTRRSHWTDVSSAHSTLCWVSGPSHLDFSHSSRTTWWSGWQWATAYFRLLFLCRKGRSAPWHSSKNPFTAQLCLKSAIGYHLIAGQCLEGWVPPLCLSLVSGWASLSAAGSQKLALAAFSHRPWRRKCLLATRDLHSFWDGPGSV